MAVTHVHIVCLFLILRASVRLLITFPNIVCFPFNSGVAPRVKKNWLWLSLGPAFAMATNPLRTKRSLWWNSSLRKNVVQISCQIYTQLKMIQIEPRLKWKITIFKMENIKILEGGLHVYVYSCMCTPLKRFFTT